MVVEEFLSRVFVKMFSFVLVPRNLILSGARRDSILSPLWKTAHKLTVMVHALLSAADCVWD